MAGNPLLGYTVMSSNDGMRDSLIHLTRLFIVCSQYATFHTRIRTPLQISFVWFVYTTANHFLVTRFKGCEMVMRDYFTTLGGVIYHSLPVFNASDTNVLVQLVFLLFVTLLI